MLVRFSMAVLIACASVAPAAAEPPSITGYFGGTWACDSTLGSKVVKAYGLTQNGQTLVLVNPYVTSTLQLGRFEETYAQGSGGITLTSSLGQATLTASSAGWDGDTLAFLGTIVDGTRTTQQRETYRRKDADHFTRTFETAADAAGPWTTTSQEACRRIAAATPVAATFAGSTNPTALQKLAARIAGGGKSKIFVAALPDDWHAAVPLPDGVTLVGSVERGSAIQVYYDLGSNTATLAAYAAQLQSAGWTPNSSLALFQGGFATKSEIPDILCGTNGKPAVSITSPSGPDRSFSVTIAPKNPLCASGGPLAMFRGLRGPLPSLVAPEGVKLTGSSMPFRFGSTGATLVSKTPLPALVESFAAQMVAAKWQRLDTSVGVHTATASFSLTDEHGTPWEAVITIYAAPGRDNTYYSLIDTTNLNGESLPGAGSMFPSTAAPDQ
jgi:hypothetical protein